MSYFRRKNKCLYSKLKFDLELIFQYHLIDSNAILNQKVIIKVPSMLIIRFDVQYEKLIVTSVNQTHLWIK